VKPSRVSRAQERAEAEEFDLDDEDDDDEPETFSYDELADDNKEPETDYDLESDVMKAHQKSSIGNDVILHYIRQDYPEPRDFADFVYLSQVMQGRGMGSEHSVFALEQFSLAEDKQLEVTLYERNGGRTLTFHVTAEDLQLAKKIDNLKLKW